MKKTLIIGASPNPERYSYKAAHSLTRHGHQIIQIGKTDGEVASKPILQGKPQLKKDIDTVTLYVSPQNQVEWYDYVLALKPKRVVFNPGTENPEFEALLENNGIEPLEACTLVLLAIGAY